MGARKTKIFGIGLSKTGTTSLAHALEILDYKTKDYPGIETYRAGDLSSIDLDIVDAYDALTDTPIPSFYRELDTRYPSSKFVLTVREMDGWLRSCKRQFTERLAEKRTEAHNQLFMDLYGCVVFDEQKFIDGYKRFVDGVMEYFRDREKDLLIINIADSEGWEKLCPFLGHNVPDIPFPKSNVTEVTWVNINDVISIVRQAGQIFLRFDRNAQWHIGKTSHFGNWNTRIAFSQFIARACYMLRWGSEGALRWATRLANHTLVNGLKQLTPRIPVVSRDEHIAPYSERQSWHHLWLVDPLSGMNDFLAGRNGFTMNVALVEDGRPYYGVVYAPAIDTVYYATHGKGAFKIESGAEPKKLECRDLGRATQNLGNLRRNDGEGRKALPASCALAMCLVAEGEADAFSWPQTAAEWETAAAHAIAQFTDRRVTDCRSRRLLTYNTPELRHDGFVIE